MVTNFFVIVNIFLKSLFLIITDYKLIISDVCYLLIKYYSYIKYWLNKLRKFDFSLK